VRALDLTRVLAGPTSGRVLAENGADVLHIAAPHLPYQTEILMDAGRCAGRAAARYGSIVLDIAREEGAIVVRFVTDGVAGQPHHLVSPWKPSDPVWEGTVDGLLIAVQVRPINNGVRLAHQAAEAPVYVFTEAEATSARLMPVVTAADTGKNLLCPMPGLVVSDAASSATGASGSAASWSSCWPRA
jgi:hypothetical protein